MPARKCSRPLSPAWTSLSCVSLNKIGDLRSNRDHPLDSTPLHPFHFPAAPPRCTSDSRGLEEIDVETLDSLHLYSLRLRSSLGMFPTSSQDERVRFPRSSWFLSSHLRLHLSPLFPSPPWRLPLTESNAYLLCLEFLVEFFAKIVLFFLEPSRIQNAMQ